MDDSCLFCKIIQGTIPADKVFETDQVLAFKDINPVAPVHVLIIPKRHLASLNELSEGDHEVAAGIFDAARRLGAELPELGGEYRLLTSCGESAGQVVPHLHFHLIGGRRLNWPPG